MILIPLFAILFVSTNALRCYECENAKTLTECHQNGRIRNCNSNERACQTHVRRGSYGILYEKKCKERHACNNNQIQNPRPASHPSQCNTQGDTSVCRCCCFTDLCMYRQGCPRDRPTPPPPSDIPTPTPPDEFCEPPKICGQCYVECPPSRPDGNYELKTQCEYSCPEGVIDSKFASEGKITCRLGSLNGLDKNSFLPMLNEECLDPNPSKPCTDPPVWENGIVRCTPPAPEGRGDGKWLLGDVCDFECPEGYTLVGDKMSVCDERTDPNTGITKRTFEPQHPCCEPDCEPTKAADITFVLDSSTSVGKKFWPVVMNFVRDVTGEFMVSDTGVKFGVLTFGFHTYLNNGRVIKLSDASNDAELQHALDGIQSFYSEGKGTNTIEALLDTTRIAFSTGFGSRPEIKSKIVIFVTDGRSNIPYKPDRSVTVATAAKGLKAKATKVFAIGIGNQIKINELNTIASSKDDVILYNDFNSLDPEKITSLLQEIACKRECS